MLGIGANGFTLVELLVCTVIVGMLASLLMSSLSAAKRRARQLGCISNLHQLGVAFRGAYDDLGSSRLDFGGNWPVETYRYLGSSHAVRACPTVRLPDLDAFKLVRGSFRLPVADTAGMVKWAETGGVSPATAAPWMSATYFSYAYNRWLSWSEEPRQWERYFCSEELIQAPANTPLLLDANSLMLAPTPGESGAADLYVNTNRVHSNGTTTDATVDMMVARHGPRAPPSSSLRATASEMKRWRSGMLLFDGHTEMPLLNDLHHYSWSRNWEKIPFHFSELSP